MASHTPYSVREGSSEGVDRTLPFETAASIHRYRGRNVHIGMDKPSRITIDRRIDWLGIFIRGAGMINLGDADN